MRRVASVHFHSLSVSALVSEEEAPLCWWFAWKWSSVKHATVKCTKWNVNVLLKDERVPQEVYWEASLHGVVLDWPIDWPCRTIDCDGSTSLSPLTSLNTVLFVIQFTSLTWHERPIDTRGWRAHTAVNTATQRAGDLSPSLCLHMLEWARERREWTLANTASAGESTLKGEGDQLTYRFIKLAFIIVNTLTTIKGVTVAIWMRSFLSPSNWTDCCSE